jgi:hypothetical protein
VLKKSGWYFNKETKLQSHRCFNVSITNSLVANKKILISQLGAAANYTDRTFLRKVRWEPGIYPFVPQTKEILL